MQIKTLVLSASVAALLAAPAFAGEGIYLEGHGGGNWTHDSHIKTPASPTYAGSREKVEYDFGWLGGAALGYDFGNGLRNEIEATYRSNGTDKIGGRNAGGDVSSWAFMYNVILGVDAMNFGGFKPYIGAGVGAVNTDLTARTIAGPTNSIDKSDLTFAYQGIVGAEYAIDPHWGLFADYRYLASWGGNKYTSVSGVKAKTEYDNSAIVVGLRYSFGAEPARAEEPVAAAPAPAPAPAVVESNGAVSRKYLVFFDFNRATLTPEAVDVLKQAAADANNGKAVAIDVTGHADRSGSDSYNMKLSAKRAAAVKAELAKLGITATSISTKAEGERNPLVPTDDGVKEPQNRRAEITYVIQPQK